MEQIINDYLYITVIAAALFRLPFLNFPMDEDFAFFTYRARFAAEGIKWKKDAMIFIPQWKMHLVDFLYGSRPALGVLRVRLFLLLAHCATSAFVHYGIIFFTGNKIAGLVGGLIYAFFATAPSLYAHSFNFEQIYLPVLLAAFYFLLTGHLAIAGVLLAITAMIKYSCVIYLPVCLLPAFYYHGFSGAIEIAVSSILLLATSFLIDFLTGYMDAESKKGLATRVALAMQLPKLKRMYDNPWNDFTRVFWRTFPLWLFGPPAIYSSLYGKHGAWIAAFVLATVFMFVKQQFFSRYHYIPFIAIFSIGTGGIFDYFMTVESIHGPTGIIALFFAAGIPFMFQLHFYIRPRALEVLNHYKKFDQFIYLPYLGKLMKRLIRMRKESGRIFVWGNYTQLYQHIGLPSSDQYIHYAVGPFDTEAKTGYFDTVVGGIIRHKPIYIIKTFHDLDMELLQEITGLKYRLVKTVLARFPVYRFDGVINEKPDPLALPWKEKGKLMDKLTSNQPHSPGVNAADHIAGETRRAIKESLKLFRMNKYDLDGALFLARLLDLTGRKDDSGRVLMNVLHLDNRFRGANKLLGLQRIFTGEVEEAEQLIRRESGIYGEDFETAFYTGYLHNTKGEPETANEFFKKSLEMAKENPEVLFSLSQSMSTGGEPELAEFLLNGIWNASQQGVHDRLRRNAALELARIRKNQAPVEQTLLEYLERDSGNPYLKYTAASTLDGVGKKDEAQKLFNKLTDVCDLNEIKGAAYYKLSLMASGKEQKELLRKCLDVLPTHSAAKHLLEATR